MNKLKKAGIWFVTLATFVTMQIVAHFVSSFVGVPTMLDVEPHTVYYGRGAESEVSSITTTFGWGFNIASILAAVAVWYLIQGKRGSREDEGFFIGWLIGAAILTVGGILIWKLFSSGFPVFAVNILDIALTGGAFYLGYRVWQNSKQIR